MLSPFPADWFLIEGVMTTLAPEGGVVNIAPMGPIVDPGMSSFVFRPFRSSTTYRNLKAHEEGVFHVTDDALLIARAALGRVEAARVEAGAGEPGDVNGAGGAGAESAVMRVTVRAATVVRGVVLVDACRAIELRVTELDDREERTTIRAEAVHGERLRDFVGFHRARHAVLEAAILATRVNLTGAATVLAEYERLGVIVDKTGSERERTAMEELGAFVKGKGEDSPGAPRATN